MRLCFLNTLISGLKSADLLIGVEFKWQMREGQGRYACQMFVTYELCIESLITYGRRVSPSVAELIL